MTEQTALMNDAGAPTDAGTGTPPPPTTPPPAPPAGPGSSGPGSSGPGSSGGPGTPHQPGATPRVPWYRMPVARDTGDNVLGGVVAGISRTYGFDRRTTRLALVLIAFVLPVVVLAYVVAWILLPDAPERAQSPEQIVRDERRFPLYAAIGLLVLAGGIGSIGSWFVFGDVPWGLGLIAIGVLLWMAPGLRRERRAASGTTPPAPTSGPTASGTWPVPADTVVGAAPTDAPTTVATVTATNATTSTTSTTSTTVAEEAGGGSTPPSATTDATDATDASWSSWSNGPTGTAPLGVTTADGSVLVAPPPPARRRRRRIPIGSVTLLAVVAGIAVAAAGDAFDWWNASVLGIIVTSLVVMAVGLAVSTVVNAAWWFVPGVVVLASAAGLLSITDPSLDGGTGERTARPTTVADAETVHDLGLGQLTLDLVDVPLDADEPVRVRAEVGIGRLHVIVPAGAELVVTSEVGAGLVLVGDREVIEGIDQRDVRSLDPLGDRTGTIELDLRVGIGEIDVDRDVFVAGGTSDPFLD